MVDEGEGDIVVDGEAVDQVERLKDKTDLGRAERREIVIGEEGDILPIEQIRATPARSRHPKRCISVDLPDPDGPMMANISPRLMEMSIPLRIDNRSLPRK